MTAVLCCAQGDGSHNQKMTEPKRKVPGTWWGDKTLGPGLGYLIPMHLVKWVTQIINPFLLDPPCSRSFCYLWPKAFLTNDVPTNRWDFNCNLFSLALHNHLWSTWDCTLCAFSAPAMFPGCSKYLFWTWETGDATEASFLSATDDYSHYSHHMSLCETHSSRGWC